jgi:hypothetical protein
MFHYILQECKVVFVLRPRKENHLVQHAAIGNKIALSIGQHAPSAIRVSRDFPNLKVAFQDAHAGAPSVEDQSNNFKICRFLPSGIPSLRCLV